MYTYKTLEHISLKTLFDAFLSAFEGFPITKTATFADFQAMLNRRGYDPASSVGAFNEQGREPALAGFLLNGYRPWGGKRTVYHILTGTLPACRRQGVGNALFERQQKILHHQNAEQYVTETLQNNASAMELYRKQGFAISRELISYQLQREAFIKSNPAHDVAWAPPFSRDEWEWVKSFWLFTPSWQNSIASVCAAQECMLYACVRLDNRIAGYAIADQRTGDIPQLAIGKPYRRAGIAKAIVAALFERLAVPALSIQNADPACVDMTHFLLTQGFEETMRQYELIFSPGSSERP